MPPPEASRWVILDLEDALFSEILGGDWPQLKEVIVKVQTEAQKQSLVDGWRTEAAHDPLWSQAEQDRREAMVRFVVD